jgi:nicotinate-nucleotide adenylyltransferase
VGNSALKIGLFGGTFNPVHFGHLNLAIELKEKGELNEIWVIPAFYSPLRRGEELVEPHHRLRMAELAFLDIPNFRVLDIEIQRKEASYTIETIHELIWLYPEKKFYLLLGEDALLQFAAWRSADEIIQLVPLLIGSRLLFESDLRELSFPHEWKEAIERGRIQTEDFGISATRIRERLKKGLYCGHLLPAKVLDYILENQLYFTNHNL